MWLNICIYLLLKISWIDTFVKQNPNFIKRFKYTYITDEVSYQTLLMSSLFRNEIISDDLRYKDWGNVDALHPRILNKTDFQKLKESKSLFARKFDATVDADVLDMIDELIVSDSWLSDFAGLQTLHIFKLLDKWLNYYSSKQHWRFSRFNKQLFEPVVKLRRI